MPSSDSEDKPKKQVISATFLKGFISGIALSVFSNKVALLGGVAGFLTGIGVEQANLYPLPNISDWTQNKWTEIQEQYKEVSKKKD